MKKHLLFILVPCFIIGCSQSQSNTPTQQTTLTNSTQDAIDDGHTAENSLDWTGIYEGTLPCADCEGINTRLTLNKNHTYILEEQYIKNSQAVLTDKYQGNFTFNKDKTSLIQLDAKADHRMFFIGEGFVQVRDIKTGEVINNKLPDKLKKISNR